MNGLTPGQVGTTIALSAGAAVLLTMILTPAALRAPKTIKADRLQELHQIEPSPIRAIPITRQAPQGAPEVQPAATAPAPPKPVPVATAAPAQAVPQASVETPIAEPSEPGPRYRRNHFAGSDICARTGGRRIETHGGKSWRCLYARH